MLDLWVMARWSTREIGGALVSGKRKSPRFCLEMYIMYVLHRSRQSRIILNPSDWSSWKKYAIYTAAMQCFIGSKIWPLVSAAKVEDHSDLFVLLLAVGVVVTVVVVFFVVVVIVVVVVVVGGGGGCRAGAGCRGCRGCRAGAGAGAAGAGAAGGGGGGLLLPLLLLFLLFCFFFFFFFLLLLLLLIVCCFLLVLMFFFLLLVIVCSCSSCCYVCSSSSFCSLLVFIFVQPGKSHSRPIFPTFSFFFSRTLRQCFLNFSVASTSVSTLP